MGCYKYKRNEDAFTEIKTESQAYWLGFILADGCIADGGRRLSVKLKKSDESHLLKLRDFLEYAGPLGYEQSKLGKNIRRNGKKEYYPTARLRVTSKIICSDLMKHGIKPRKSLTAVFPDVREDLERHFIRGYVDGDGNWHWCGVRSKSMVLTVLGTKSFLQSLDIILKRREVANENGGRINQPSCIYSLVYGGNQQTGKIAEFLYDGANVWLERKRDYLLAHNQINMNGKWIKRGHKHQGSRNPNSKRYKIVSPKGKVHIVEDGLRIFCRKRKISYAGLLNVRFGREDNWNNWRCFLCEN